jgi:signal peptidase II
MLGPAPSGIFLFFVTFTSFVSDISSKLWAEKRLANNQIVVVLPDHLQFILAKNRGGAWGLLQRYDENVRRPFFLLVSLAAIVFIITLYRRLQPNQRALKWGLPLVLGGALGNVFDRVRYGHVIDFIDYRGAWIEKSYKFLEGFKYTSGQYITDHWPTFNVADVAICVGVGLMAVDMFTSKRGRRVVRLPLPLNIPMLQPEPSAAPAVPDAESAAPAEAAGATSTTSTAGTASATATNDAAEHVDADAADAGAAAGKEATHGASS